MLLIQKTLIPLINNNHGLYKKPLPSMEKNALFIGYTYKKVDQY